MSIGKLISTVEKEHIFTHQLEEVTNEILNCLPDDAERFFKYFDGVVLFTDDPFERNYRFVKTNELAFAKSKFNLGNNFEGYILICEHSDGVWTACNQKGTVIELYFEELLSGRPPSVICKTFCEFLTKALNSDNKTFWI